MESERDRDKRCDEEYVEVHGQDCGRQAWQTYAKECKSLDLMPKECIGLDAKRVLLVLMPKSVTGLE